MGYLNARTGAEVEFSDFTLTKSQPINMALTMMLLITSITSKNYKAMKFRFTGSHRIVQKIITAENYTSYVAIISCISVTAVLTMILLVPIRAQGVVQLTI